ncbi:MAG: DUF4407 domain-containing protein [Lactobacillus sp.]|jgi:hypothetical protein|nr:DUF4407 domain-containing protein [Lactobacillus sp.]MCH3905940.1 DUF4407 domain-containing protein [Lactobacillus sp.]MCH3990486.1 DUF4407 domain-containing protein [Lactobacillus sp.]MCH4068799.1 DUF4407 domain-containing protein [Lactobacillus sp.]MCI1304424.1 DUF4407 domain-containing protein [Lactobacillus sp.]
MKNMNRDLFWAYLFGFIWLVAIFALVRHIVYYKFSWEQVGQGILWVVLIGLVMGDFIYRYVKQRRIEKIKLRKNKKSC